MNQWRSVAAVAATYFYFLLFAQFAFLEGLMAGGLGEGALKPVMAAMGCGGLLGSFGAPWLVGRLGARRVMRFAFALCALLAVASIRLGGVGAGAAMALLIGVALGVQTVTLAGCLPGWVARDGTGGIVVGLGTGLAYALCNVPAIFQSSWVSQSVMAAGLAVLGVVLVPGGGEGGAWRPARSLSGSSGPRGAGAWKPVVDGGRSVRQIWAVVLLLMALVWLDSAVFFIIQHTEEMKKATWGTAHLWRNAGLHFAGAVVAGIALDRGLFWRVLFGALALLSLASQMLNHEELMRGAGGLYPVGVSLYSVVLVVFPGFLSGASTQGEALRRAAWVFALAGWVGSALGVGMGENLHEVPGWFVLAVGGVLAAVAAGLSSLSRLRLAALGVGVPGLVLLAWSGWRAPDDAARSARSAPERGHEVYLSEGCIHCHSRYVRPGTADALMWGPTRPLEEVRQDRPVTIGNRRQGPDLAQVGLRRSAKWLELHFRKPRLFDATSTMPAYGYLFEDGRGDDLVRYLGEVNPEDWAKRHEAIGAWNPGEIAGVAGAQSYHRYCVACHGAEGRGDGPLAREFMRPPVDLAQGPFIHTLVARPGESLRVSVARVVKFGVPGTDMPGHELIRDAEALGLADWVLDQRRNRGLKTPTDN